MKYYRYILIVLVTILFLPLPGQAYEYQNSQNKEAVERYVKDIHDLKEMYDDLIIEEEDEDDNVSVEETDNVCGGSSSYMWPIGSDKITRKGKVEFATDTPNTVNITSWFGARKDPFTGQQVASHGAIDIAPSAEAGKVNVIAAQSGEIVVASSGCTSYGDKSCGGGFGNYIVIKHSDDNYTYYAHLHQKSITVKVGQKVSQGQVIAKVGSSGRSTGTHLHFEVRKGSRDQKSRVDPLKYVDPKKPRPEDGGSSDDCELPQEFAKFVAKVEGENIDDNEGYYEAKYVGDTEPWTIGPGLTRHNKTYFKKYGIDSDQIHVGTKLKKSIVNKVYGEVILAHRKEVEQKLNDNNIKLNNNQILALTSWHFNGPKSIDQFIEQYKKTGNSYKLYDPMCHFVHSGGNVFGGLIKRRKLEWILYSSGILINDRANPADSQSSDNNTVCVGNFSIPHGEQSKVTDMLKQSSEKYNGTINYY